MKKFLQSGILTDLAILLMAIAILLDNRQPTIVNHILFLAIIIIAFDRRLTRSRK